MKHPAILLGLAAALAAIPTRGDEPDDRPPLELRDGDRVVLVGDALIERMQDYGDLETLLTAAYPDRSITFRNLGWSGDTVFGTARAGFGTPEDGFKALVEQVNAAAPTVLIVGYGANESWAGEEGLPRFREGYERLLDALEATGAREIVLLSPISRLGIDSIQPFSGVTEATLRQYTEVIGEIANRRDHRFADIYMATFQVSRSRTADGKPYYESDGIHLADQGYDWLIPPLNRAVFGVWLHSAGVVITAGDVIAAQTTHCSIDNVVATPDGLRFELARSFLPHRRSEGPDLSCGSISVGGLPDGRYRVHCDGRPLPDGHGNVVGSVNGHVAYTSVDGHPNPGNGTTLIPGLFIADCTADREQYRALRQAIIAKNRLVFDRWRPQNTTYLFGFRKHEQGNNAAEIDEFDALIAEAEAEIARLKVPKPHIYELSRIEDAEDIDR